MTIQSRLKGAAAPIALSVALLAQPAFAQDASTDSTVSPAPAATPVASADDNAIIVTGSRIAGAKYDTVQPVQTLSSDQIEARGFDTLGQALNELPSFGVPDSSTIGTQSSYGPGQSFVNFFGLGSQRTLTLVNGRRFVGSNTSSIFGPTGLGGDQVDLNLIPTKLIDRVETVAVGGAPIYGSDAIAGTINVILKKDYEGLDVDGQYGASVAHNDARDYRIRVLAGHNFLDGRANLTFAGEYNKSDGLLYTDRKISALGRYYDDPSDPSYPYTQQLYEHRTIPGISDTGTPLVGRFGYDLLGLNADLAPVYQEAFSGYAEQYGGAPPGTPFNLGVTGIGGNPENALKFDNSGNLIPIDFGNPTSVTNSSGGNGYSLTDLSNLLTATQRYSAIVLGSFDVSDNIRLFGEGWYTHSEGTNLRDQPEYKSGFFGAPGEPSGDIVLSVNNPFLSTAARDAILNSIANNPLSDQNLGYTGSQDYFYLGRANTDLVTGRVKGEVDVYRFIGGLDGSFNVGGHDWNWEVVANYGHSKTYSTIPTIIEQNFLNAVGAVTDDNPTGTPCLAGLQNSAAPTISETCSALDVFGNGVASQAARDYVTGLATPTSINQQFDATASLTGSLFTMPGGDVQFAAGVEHRWEHETFDPSLIFHGGPDPDPTVDENGDGDPTDDFVQFGQTVSQSPIDAGFHTNEVFGELHVPLVGEDMHVPLMQALEIQAAGRYVDHSVSGGAFTWTLGGRWTVVPDLTIRGNFTHSIRSPSITESEAPAQTYFDLATDPCDPAELANGPAPATRATNCHAALAAAGLDETQIENYSSLSGDRTFLQAVAGETTLEPETANSWTVGAVFQPRFLRGFTLSADYVDIKVKGTISDFSADDVLSGCYDSSSYPDNQYCSRIQRDDSGQLSYIVTGYINRDQLRYRGIVAQGEYRTRTPFLGAESALSFGLSYQHLFELSTTTAGVVTRTDGDAGYSKDKGVLTIGYTNGGFDFTTQLSYIGPAAVDVTYAPDYIALNHYNAVLFTDIGASYTFNNRFDVRFNIDNLFDTKPPYPATGATDVYFRGLLGTTFKVGAGVHF